MFKMFDWLWYGYLVLLFDEEVSNGMNGSCGKVFLVVLLLVLNGDNIVLVFYELYVIYVLDF